MVISYQRHEVKLNLTPEKRALIEAIIKENPAYQGNERLMEKFCAEIYKKSYLLLDSVSNVESLKNYLTKVAETSIANVVMTAEKNKIHMPPIPQKNDLNFQPQDVAHRKQIDFQSKRESRKKLQTSYTKPVAQKIETKKTRISNIENAFSNIDFKSKEGYRAQNLETKLDFKPQIQQEKIQPPKKSFVNLKEREISTNLSDEDKYGLLIDPLEFSPKKNMADSYAKKLAQVVKKIDTKNPEKNYLEIFEMRYVKKMHANEISAITKIPHSDLSMRFCEMALQIQRNMG